MAFFKQSQPSTPPPPQVSRIPSLLAPVTVRAGDAEVVAGLLTELDAAMSQRNSDRIYEFGIAFNRAGGFPDTSRMSKYEDASVMMEIAQAGGAVLQRPWRWLAAVARQALEQGNADLVSRISATTWIWSVEFAPKMNAGAFFEGVVTKADDASLAAIYSTVIEASAVVGDNGPIQRTATLVAKIVVEQLRAEVQPEVLAAAQRLVA